MPLELGIRIPEDDSVRTLIEVTEGMDYGELNRAYAHRSAEGEATPRQMFLLVILGFMNGIYTTRGMEAACRVDIRFMWILQGKRVPDHCRFARFIQKRLKEGVAEHLFNQVVQELQERSEIPGENLFVDGTKIEANANRYTFVWGKQVGKRAEKVEQKLEELLKEIRKAYVLETAEAKTPSEILAALYAAQKQSGEESVHGKGKRKKPLQRRIEALDALLKKREEYCEKRKILDNRPSYSKTDHDATFMRMKEDHMGNGQLKPAYNVQLGVEGEYVVGIDVSAERSDVNTLLPLLKRIETGTGIRHKNVVTDAGYESEENYTGLIERGQNAYIKPANYERSKGRSFRGNAYLRENMPYDERADAYTCPAGKYLTFQGESIRTSKTGFRQVVSRYACEDCGECPHKSKCTKAKENRAIEFSKRFAQQRAASLVRITSEQGIILRENRSIQSEGTFGVLKEDWGFRRFLRRGRGNVTTELFLYGIAFDVCKLHAKMMNGRLKKPLFIPVGA
jgi:transposase